MRIVTSALAFMAILLLALPATAARPDEYRQDLVIAPILQAITDIAENARTDIQPEDMIMGRIMGLAAALRYPLTMADVLGKSLDASLTMHTDRKNREMALQTARVILSESIQGVLATQRSIKAAQDQAAKQPDRKKAILLLQNLAAQGTAVRELLESMNGRCIDSKLNNVPENRRLDFLDESKAQAAQQEKDALLDSLLTDWEQQNFLGGLVYKQVEALRYPNMDAIRIAFFLERVYGGNVSSSERGMALAVALPVLDRHALSVRQIIWHLDAMAKGNQGNEPAQRLLHRALECHRRTLELLDDIRERLNKTSL